MDDLEDLENYIDYAVILSLSLIAISSIYILDTNNLYTFLGLISIPILLGFTAEISKAGFSKATLSTLIIIPFGLISLEFLIAAITIIILTTLTSFFAGGRRFKDFYSATAIPLLLTGVILGGTTFYLTQTNPTIEETVIDTKQNSINQLMNHTQPQQLITQQEELQEQQINQSIENTVTSTQIIVLNQTSNDLNRTQQQNLDEAFQQAKIDLKQQSLEQEDLQQDKEIQEMTNQIVENLVTEENLILIIPGLALLLYALQPLVGFLTGIFGYGFYRVRSRS